jgi:hypothetical protein
MSTIYQVAEKAKKEHLRANLKNGKNPVKKEKQIKQLTFCKKVLYNKSLQGERGKRNVPDISA